MNKSSNMPKRAFRNISARSNSHTTNWCIPISKFVYGCRFRMTYGRSVTKYYHATEKLCSIEIRVHLEKSVIKARHGPFSRHGHCNDLHVLRWKNEWSAMTLGRSPCENEWKVNAL